MFGQPVRSTTPDYIASFGNTQSHSDPNIELPGAQFSTDVSLEDSTEPTPIANSWLSNFDEWSGSSEAYFAIPGPSMPSDPPNTVYDLCGGAADQEEEPLSDLEEDDDIFHPSVALATGTSIAEDPPVSTQYNLDHQSLYPRPDIGSGTTLFVSIFTIDDRYYWLEQECNPIAKIPGLDMDSESWWPFKGPQEALVSSMTAFPRAVFSGQEINVVRWYSKKCNIPDVPANSTVQTRFDEISTMLGLDSRLVKSGLGNYFAVNSIGSIIANEMANPLVRNQMVFYPQDDNGSMSKAANGGRWMKEINATLAAPMVRKQLLIGHHDYYVHEPYLASYREAGSNEANPTPLISMRYFERSGELYARSHRLIPIQSGYVIDGTEHLDIPLSDFLLPLPEFRAEHKRYNMGSPEVIYGIQFGDKSSRWTEPNENPWRARSAGKIVRSAPIWMYCDDTSGNVSKKWNKHNSFLFTLAGLPREQSQHAYNVQFLATSNIASPLEMLDEISSELQELHANGIEAYDSSIGEDVIVIPWIYAMQGDNPMQSEFCSHIGMAGKHFCRVCHVRGKDKDRAEDDHGDVDRIQEFMKIHDKRHAADTIQALHEQEAIGLRGAFSMVDETCRKTGVKDKYLNAYLNLLKERLSSEKRTRAGKPTREFLEQLRHQLPERIFNPALYITHLDPNQDTPVEILHVILLGVTKYFWRDAVARQNNDGRELLKARINSLDLRGLDLSTPQGVTLVQYAKSLTGGDFRVVLQIAPIVLYGSIPENAYKAWLALCHLAPLAFQQEITNLQQYLPKLYKAIDLLLQATVTWSPQWFNKPKFHVLLHLPEHVERFGPAVLFATETFESYNHVIRLRSVHSNRRAPSRDIGQAFCRLYAIRFLVSGGWITHRYDKVNKQRVPCEPRQAGSSILELKGDRVFTELMGMSHFWYNPSYGSFSLGPGQVFWSETLAAKSVGAPNLPETVLGACVSISLKNHDKMRPGSFVLVMYNQERRPAEVIEMWASLNPLHFLGVTIRLGHFEGGSNLYCMPHVKIDGELIFLTLEAIVCVISLFHNCAAHNCDIARNQVVLQERQETEHRGLAVQHSGDRSDQILNTASLRNAELLQDLRNPPMLLGDTDLVAQQAVIQWRAQQEKEVRDKAEKDAEKEKKKADRKRKQEEKSQKQAEQHETEGEQVSKRKKK
ncbi:hypothetical protein RhiJN_24944 [Ceratobasidium sp. AG-Ba]|nr:hypothetical protein RhiJN_24944 [Ceratobasidium sp. AG-Ba]